MCVHSVVFSSFSDLFYGWSIERKQHTCYVALTRTLDSHDVTRGRGSLEEVLGGVQLPVLVAGITSDVLYPLHMQSWRRACRARRCA